MIIEINNNEFKELKETFFTNEKELQRFVEANMSEITGYDFLTTEFTVENYRLDSVAFDKESKAFVIVEYKNGRNESLVDQGYSYLNKLLTRKAEFVLMYNDVLNENNKVKDFDWSQSKIVFISPRFTDYQKDATAFKNMAFELYEIRKYENNIIHIERLKKNKISNFDFGFKNNSQINEEIKNVNKEIIVYDEQYHLDYMPENIQALYFDLKERILSIDSDLYANYTKYYISFKKGSRGNIILFEFHKKHINILLTVPDNKLDDPKQLTKKPNWTDVQYLLKVNLNRLIRKRYNYI